VATNFGGRDKEFFVSARFELKMLCLDASLQYKSRFLLTEGKQKPSRRNEGGPTSPSGGLAHSK